MNKKKLLFTAYNLDIGGIETALISLLENLCSKYDITLVLEDKKGIFLESVPQNVKIIDYHLSHNKFVLYRKIKNRLKLWKWKITHKNKYDFAICFATHSILGSHLALNGSKNNAIWVHGDYYDYFDKDVFKLKKFLKKIQFLKYKNYVYVSNQNKESMNRYIRIKGNQYVINNLINAESILNKSKEQIDVVKGKEILFINVGRHDESQKKLTRIIIATQRLIKEGYKFKILFIGDGPDNLKYKNLVKQNKLDKVIIFVGKKANPYPYFVLSDAILLSSDSEGYPVVFNEAKILNIPLITTKVSDYEEIDNKYGIVVDKDKMYEGMKKFLQDGFTIKKAFNYNQYNKEIINKINKIIDN